jgi:DNA-binding transcriptional LysR family regulator
MLANARSLNLHQLEIFAEAAHRGSFTRAAQALFLSEPAVSQQIKLLEATVGAQLFERLPRRPIRLTDSGWVLLRTCRTVFQELDASLARIESLQGVNSTRVSVGAGTGYGSYVLPKIVAAFREKHSGIPVSMHIEMSGRWVERVRRREVDIAVITGVLDDPEITAVPFDHKDLVWVAPLEHPLASRASIPVQGLQGERLVVAAPPSAGQRALDWVAETRRVVLYPAFELAGTEACITAALNGIGVALVPYGALLWHELLNRVAVLDVEGFPVRSNRSLIWRTEDLSPTARLFRDYLLGFGRCDLADGDGLRSDMALPGV